MKPLLPHSDGDYNSSSTTEKIFFDHVKRHIQQHNKSNKQNDTNLSVHSNEMVNGFSTDILIRRHLPSTSHENENINTSQSHSQSQLLANIEIDGPSHKFPRKRRFMHLRDSFLERTHGVAITRVDVLAEGYHGSKLEHKLEKLLRNVDRQL